MAFSRNVGRAPYHIIFAVWIVAFNLCGTGALIPSILQIPHHSSRTANLDCEGICLSREVAHTETAVEHVISKVPRLDTSAIAVSSIGVQDITAYHLLENASVFSSTSIKLYQLTRSYRL